MNPAIIFVFLADFAMPKTRTNRHYFGSLEVQVEWNLLDSQAYLTKDTFSIHDK